MAIPKEPRQLMINIMYLVLTALLALNVSAEIFNGFKVVDKGLNKSNKVLDKINSELPGQISKFAQKKEELKVYAERTEPVRSLSKEFNEMVDAIENDMIEQSGGWVGEGEGRTLKGYKDYNVTTRVLVDEGQGEKIKNRLTELKTEFLQYINPEDRDAFKSSINIDLDTSSWLDINPKDNRSWSEFNFSHMPLQAVLPILNKYKNDVKSTESAVLNYLLGKVGGEDIVLDQFQVVAVPKKSYVIKGEPYEAEIFLSASAGSSTNTGLEISVGGSSLNVVDGVAKFTTGTSSTGVKNYNASIRVTNPVTGEVKIYENTFDYEVGERSVSVSAEKMNVMYIGVDNPISVTAAGISSNQMQVSGSGAGINISKTANGKYNARVSSQGVAKITVSGGGLTPTTSEFRTKLIPTPVPKLSSFGGGNIKNGVFKAQRGLIPVLENFDFDAKCNIKGFQLVRVPQRGDAVPVVNPGQSYGQQATAVVQQAQPGDLYLYRNIKCQCPGWPAVKSLPDIVFNID